MPYPQNVSLSFESSNRGSSPPQDLPSNHSYFPANQLEYYEEMGYPEETRAESGADSLQTPTVSQVESRETKVRREYH